MSSSNGAYRRGRDDSQSFDGPRRGLDAWLDAIIYYGLGQHLLLALPMLWVAFSAVSMPVAVTTSAIVSLGTASLTIGAFRMGVISVGTPWQRIEDNELGLGPDAGYGFLVRRGAYLNATFGLGTFLGATADVGGGGLLGAVVVAGGITFGALLAMPKIRASTSKRALVIRGVFYSVSLVVVGVTGEVLNLSVGAPSSALAFAVVCLVVAFDVGMDAK